MLSVSRPLLMTAVLLGAIVAAAAQDTASSDALHLREGWALESGCKVQARGDAISTPAFRAAGWRGVTVPSTVLAAQVAEGQFPEPYFGTNLRNIPGTSYPLGENFSNLPMPANSPYRCAWWFRKEFTAHGTGRGATLLHFDGINYRANIWLNGKLVAGSDQVAGAYRTYDFDITKYVRANGPNVLAVETFAPTETDLGVNWVDWSPCPPDKDMGLTGAVYLRTTGPITVDSPLVTTHFQDASLNDAALTVFGELRNASDAPVHGIAVVSLLGKRLTQQVDLAAGEQKTVVFLPENYPELRVQHPGIWWPYGMGAPRLQTLSLEFATGGRVSDGRSIRFGIREITSELTDKGYRLFRVNGKSILIRGAGWSQDMLLREDSERLRQQFALVRDMHLNTIRLEGKLETEDFYRLADEQGILVMAGWCCCDQWEHWDKWTPENFDVAKASLRSQMLRIRHHASLLVWLNGSDNPPPAKVETAYLDIEAQTHWPNPTLSSASETPTTVSGKSGVKMSGPYDYVAPSYWLVDVNRRGGAFGFNTETSPGPAIPTVSSLRKFLPADQMWPPNGDWDYHNGGEGFQKLNVFNDALNATYGQTQSLIEYEREAQAMAYDAERAMFEAYGRNKYTSTGVIQWMLNNAWPSMIWHLYDYYLDAGGGYFGAKKACEPLHIQYSYDDRSVFVVNSRYEPVQTLRAFAKVYDLHLKLLFSKEADIRVGADASVQAISLPDSAFRGVSDVYFVQLELRNAKNEPVSQNFYWVPATLTDFDWSKTDYTHTPARHHEDMTVLRSLPVSAVSVALLPSADGRSMTLRLSNPTQALALQVSARALDAAGQALEPAFWSDNYISLMPGEARTLTVKLWPGRHDDVAAVAVSGWNIKTVVAKPRMEKTLAER